MPKVDDLEFKVGAFVAASVLALVAFVFSISDFSVFQKGTQRTVIFQFANGLKKGAPVRVAGVDAGHVRDLKIYYDTTALKTLVRIHVWLEHGVAIPVDSRVMINQLGLLGEKYVEILPGTSPQPFPDDQELRGDDPVAMESIMAMVGSIAGKIDVTLTGVNQKLLTEGNARALSETLQNLALITGAIKNGEGTAGLFLKDKKLYEDLTAITGAIRNGEGTIGKFLTDKSVFQNLEEFTADLKANPWKLFYRPKK